MDGGKGEAGDEVNLTALHPGWDHAHLGSPLRVIVIVHFRYYS